MLGWSIAVAVLVALGSAGFTTTMRIEAGNARSDFLAGMALILWPVTLLGRWARLSGELADESDRCADHR